MCVAQTNGWIVITSSKDTLASCTIDTNMVDRMVSIVSGDSMIKISVDSLGMLVRKNSQVESVAVGLVIGGGVKFTKYGPYDIFYLSKVPTAKKPRFLCDILKYNK